jgi:DNA polymerase-3 subunit alpha
LATPLHNHTNYSLLDGLSTPEDIANRAKDLGFEAVGCTDHDVVAGHIEFFQTVSDAGLKPLLGIETYQAPVHRSENYGAQRDKVTKEKIDNFHLILLAMNNTGLENLWQMNTEAHRTGFYYHGRVDWELLEKYNEGIVCTSACGGGLLPQMIQQGDTDKAGEVLRRYLDIFGDRFYIELGTYPEDWQKELNVNLLDYASIFGVPVVYGNDAHYARPDQYDLHEAVMALQMGTKLKDPDRMSHEPDLYIMSAEDVRAHLDYLPQSAIDDAINNTDAIAAMSDVTLPGRRNRIPVFMPDKRWGTSRDMLYDLAVEGFMEKVAGINDEEYMARFKKEIEVIFDAGLTDYFLIVRDYIVNFAKVENILVGPGRGSAGGSLIAYLLGITDLDPIKYGLIFERFYNAGRETGLPDIDTDFPKNRRDDVFQYILSKYGPDYVANLPTLGRMQSKSAIKDMGRVLSISMNDTAKISDILDQTIKQGLQADSWEEIEEAVGEELKPWEDKYPTLFEYAKALHKHIRTYGVHASGVVISDEPLSKTYPLKWNAKQQKMVAQFDMEVADEFGFMKMDLLSLRNLDTLDEVNNILRSQGQDEIDFYAIQHMEHDPGVFELLEKGLTVGIFQIEDGGLAKQIAKSLKPSSIDDLGVIVAMNRPGPLLAGAYDTYMHGKNGGEVHYAHPYLADILERTFGVFLYQEQVIEFMTQIGYNLFEADDVRSIMGKKKVEKVTAEYDRYLPRALEHMDRATADEIWQMLVNFSRYGFNKSHAIAYAIIMLMVLYTKYHYPVEFLTAGIRTVDKDHVKRYINEARRMGIDVLPPKIGQAQTQVAAVDGKIVYGFENIKFFGPGPAKWLVEHQDSFANVDELRELLQVEKVELPNGSRRVALDSRKVDFLERLGAFSVNGYEPDLDLEEELLGVALSDTSATILDDHREEIDKLCSTFEDLDEAGEYTIAAIVRDVREAKTRKNQKMYYVTLEDGHSNEIELAVWSDVYKRLDFMFRRRTAGLFHVKVTDRGKSLLNARALYRRNAVANVN